MTATLPGTAAQAQDTDNLVLVSSDCHIGPKLSQLREYCPKKHLEDFDAFAADIAKQNEESGGIPAEARDALAHMSEEARQEILASLMDEDGPMAQMLRNRRTPGHHDMNVRMEDMDRDGLACEVIFHGSQNGEPIPFVNAHDLTAGLTTPFSFLGVDHELGYAGIHMYNEWLADQITIEPDRHIALCYIPAWDPEQTEKEVRWAHSRGFRGVNMPAWRPGMPVLQDEAWEPFYAACNELKMPLTNHGGAGDDASWPQAEAVALRFVESAYHSKRLIWTLLFHGTFEKYPDLKLMISEIPGEWWPYQMKELDSIGRGVAFSMGRTASEVCAEHVFHGATFMSKEEANLAVQDDYWENICWGSDYPHVEGTWQFPASPDEEPQTHLALRDTFAGIDSDKVRSMAGLNLAEAYGMDIDKLQTVANKINAPSAEYVSQPLDDADIPANHGMFVFRRVGPWS